MSKNHIPPPRKPGAPRKHPALYDRLLKLAVDQSAKFDHKVYTATDVRGVTKYLTLRGTARYVTRTDEHGNTTVWRVE